MSIPLISWGKGKKDDRKKETKGKVWLITLSAKLLFSNKTSIVKWEDQIWGFKEEKKIFFASIMVILEWLNAEE